MKHKLLWSYAPWSVVAMRAWHVLLYGLIRKQLCCNYRTWERMIALVHHSFCFHPSLCPSIHVHCFPCAAGSQGMLDRVAHSTSCQFIAGPQHPFALTSTASLELPINLTRTSFVCGRRPENPLTTHTDSGRTGKFDCISFFALFFFFDFYFLLHIPPLYLLLCHSPLWFSLWSNCTTQIHHPQYDQ